MNVIRLISAAAVGTALVAAAAPSAQAVGSGNALDGASKATGVAAKYAVPLAAGAVGDKVGEKVQALQDTVNGGTQAVSGLNQLVN